MTTTNDFTGANPSGEDPSRGGIPRRQAMMGLGALLLPLRARGPLKRKLPRPPPQRNSRGRWPS
jgi:hypothetical protein